MWAWLLVLVGLLTAIYWYLSRNLGYWRARGVYTLPGALPLVGHMWDALVFRRGAQWIACDVYRQTKGHPAVGIYSFRQPVLLLRDPELIQTVLIKEFSSFHDNTLLVDEKLEPHISRNPFVLRGQSWKITRQKLTPAFSPGRIKVMFPQVQAVCKEFNNYMNKHLDEDVNVTQVTGWFTSEVVAKCAFGLDGNAFNDPDAPFFRNGRKLWDGSLHNPLSILIVFFFPGFNKLIGKGFFPKDVLEFFENTIKQAIDYREKNPDKVADNDYLQFLINLQNKKEFTLVDVVAQCLTFFTDGFETSSITASFAVYELAMNPEIQEAVRQEVQAMETLSYENLVALPLLDRVVQETLRKYSLLKIARECTKDYTLETNGQTIPIRKGQHIWIPVYGLHHDPEIYPDPEKFDPDRFLPENTKSRHPVSFMGFGAGPRICIGNRFAICQVKAFLSNILVNFKLVKCNKTVEKMTLNPLMIMPMSEKGIWVKFQEL